MIDFIKSNHLAIGLRIKDLLSFTLPVHPETGEVLNIKRSAKLLNLTFTITPSDPPIVKGQGSIHQFANGGLHNCDQFPLSRFREVAATLAPYISLDDPINVLEFGVNIPTPFDPSVFIRNQIAFKGKRTNITDISGEFSGGVSLGQYRFKIYNKGLQYNQGNILRIELHYSKMENLFSNGLKWGDLSDSRIWELLGKRLIKAFEKLVYYDPTINLDTITSVTDKEILIKGNNPIFWENLKGAHVSRTLDQFQRAVSKYGQLFNSLPALISEQITSLIDIGFEKEVVKSDHIEESIINTNMVNSDHIFNENNCHSLSGTYEMAVNNDPLLYGQDSPLVISSTLPTNIVPEVVEDRLCPVTGLNISIQSQNSIFLTPIGLRWLFKTQRNLFNELKQKRLSNRFIDATLDIQFREISHSVRNEYYNPIHNTKRDVDKLMSDWAVFDLKSMLSPEKWNLYKK